MASNSIFHRTRDGVTEIINLYVDDLYGIAPSDEHLNKLFKELRSHINLQEGSESNYRVLAEWHRDPSAGQD